MTHCRFRLSEILQFTSFSFLISSCRYNIYVSLRWNLQRVIPFSSVYIKENFWCSKCDPYHHDSLFCSLFSLVGFFHTPPPHPLYSFPSCFGCGLWESVHPVSFGLPVRPYSRIPGRQVGHKPKVYHWWRMEKPVVPLPRVHPWTSRRTIPSSATGRGASPTIFADSVTGDTWPLTTDYTRTILTVLENHNPSPFFISLSSPHFYPK